MEEMIDSMAVDEDFDLMHCLYIVWYYQHNEYK